MRWRPTVKRDHETEAMAEFARVEYVCELCDQPIEYGALCLRCDPDRLGLHEENLDRWSV